MWPARECRRVRNRGMARGAVAQQHVEHREQLALLANAGWRSWPGIYLDAFLSPRTDLLREGTICASAWRAAFRNGVGSESSRPRRGRTAAVAVAGAVGAVGVADADLPGGDPRRRAPLGRHEPAVQLLQLDRERPFTVGFGDSPAQQPHG